MACVGMGSEHTSVRMGVRGRRQSRFMRPSRGITEGREKCLVKMQAIILHVKTSVAQGACDGSCRVTDKKPDGIGEEGARIGPNFQNELAQKKWTLT